MSEEKASMTFLEHLAELRSRLIKSVIFLLLATIVSYLFSKPLFRYLRIPFDQAYISVYGVTPNLQNISLIEGFMVYIKVAVLSGVFFSFPFILYQILGFVLPALNPQEKKFLYPGIVLVSLFFIGGAIFGYWFVFPKSFEFLLSETAGELVEQNIRMQDYFKFSSMLLLGFGVAFELPLLVFFLVAIGVISSKQLLKSWKGALILVLILSAILTPADVSSMILMAVPLYIIYLLMSCVCLLLFPSKSK
ncbi:MAG TPA: twin-arginine translocase subunit TatC [Oligoflexia bacterium]|nr:twin-arginine translocase subunit TatC [Oligoflexia bacterium]HMR24360.1 twin-arginine translocase subunit TatC [Oligoflexia bacterium]